MSSNLLNYKKENEVGIRIYESNVKDSKLTALGGSDIGLSSPGSEIRMVNSTITRPGGDFSANRNTYPSNLGDSQRSGGNSQEASYGINRTEPKA